MKIYHNQAKEYIRATCLHLKEIEVLHLIDALQQLLEVPEELKDYLDEPVHHVHVMSEDYSHEITVTLEKEE